MVSARGSQLILSRSRKVLPSNSFHVEHVLLMVFGIRDYALRKLAMFVPGQYARKGGR